MFNSDILCPIDLLHLIEPTFEDELSSTSTSLDAHQRETTSDIPTLVSGLSISENPGWFVSMSFEFIENKRNIYSQIHLHYSMTVFNMILGFFFSICWWIIIWIVLYTSIGKTIVWLRSAHYVHGQRTSPLCFLSSFGGGNGCIFPHIIFSLIFALFSYMMMVLSSWMSYNNNDKLSLLIDYIITYSRSAALIYKSTRLQFRQYCYV